MTDPKSNLSDQESYAKGKNDALVENLNPGFGVALIDQLIHRIEYTTREFDAELAGMVERLQQNSETNEELLERIRTQYRNVSDTGTGVVDEEDDGITEWEKRLAQIESSSK
ncbi:MAG: hypothetical protein IIA59_01220 [Candidatus Marinimicrobia bacterium]|nr:hypothetical protein [Candidatus Neomarinimicrobiota bacterium]